MTIAGGSFGLSRIGQIAVVIHDLPRAVAFYRDILGMRLLFQAPPMMAFFDCAGVRLMLSLPSAPEFDHPGSIIYYTVDDIQAAARTLAARGVLFEHEPRIIARLPHADLWMAAFQDPDGNRLELMSEVVPA
jgi:catechol 2,3-dioxygenase-like lactoylglutathione lyase family enzyme